MSCGSRQQQFTPSKAPVCAKLDPLQFQPE